MRQIIMNHISTVCFFCYYKFVVFVKFSSLQMHFVQFICLVTFQTNSAKDKMVIFFIFLCLLLFKEEMREKGLRVNAGKTKIVICGMSLDLLQSSGEFPCAVCCTGVGSNSIFCNDCKPWVHKKCSGLKRLTKDPDYRYTTCTLDGRPQREVQVGPQAGGGSFRLLPRRHALSSPWLWTFNHNTCENWLEEVQGAVISSLFPPPLFQDTWPCVTVNSSCVQSAMLNASEHWPLTKPNLQRLQGNDRAMIRQCQAAMSTRKTLSPSGPMSYLHSLALRIWTSSWRREGSTDMHTLHTPRVQSRNPVTYRLMESEGPGRPKMTWKQLTERDYREWKLLAIDPHDLVWDLPCMQQASYLEGGQLMWMLPLYLHVYKKIWWWWRWCYFFSSRK